MSVHVTLNVELRNYVRLLWGSRTWYPLDVAPGDETEHIIAQASVTTLSFAFK